MRSTHRTVNRKFLIALLAIGLAGLHGSVLAAEDHSEHFDGPLNSGPEVTEACLECHDVAARDMMNTSHWTWSSLQTIGGKQVKRGKVNALNNF